MKSKKERPTQKTIFLPKWENKQLRKILTLVKFGLIFLFTATVTGYTQIYGRQGTENTVTTGIYNDLSDNSANNDGESSRSSGGLYRDDTQGPGTRPKPGEGIGQEAPIKDGLGVLVACSILFGIVEVVLHKNANNK